MFEEFNSDYRSWLAILTLCFTHLHVIFYAMEKDFLLSWINSVEQSTASASLSSFKKLKIVLCMRVYDVFAVAFALTLSLCIFVFCVFFAYGAPL